LVPVECHLGWNNQGNAVTVVAVVTLNEKRQGVLAVSHLEKSVESSLHKGITLLLRKVVASSSKQASFIWSIPAYSTLCIMMGQSFVQEVEYILSSVRNVERQEGEHENKQMEEILEWSKPQLLTENGWKTQKIIGTTLEEVQKYSEEKKKKPPLTLPKIQWATLFDVPDSYVAFDLETTSTHIQFARIIEIGAVKVHRGELSTFHTYVNPQMKIPKSIRNLTQVTQKQVDEAPFPWQAIRSFFKFVGRIPLLVGHNVKYDINVLQHNCSRFKIPLWKGEAFCTQQYAKQLMMGIPNTKLESVCDALQIVNPAPHQALADADCSRLVFEKLLGREQHLLMPETVYQKIHRA
jgi:DNA polymerase III epsilon subunit-like protein